MSLAIPSLRLKVNDLSLLKIKNIRLTLIRPTLQSTSMYRACITPGLANPTRLNKIYGKTKWKKLKGICHIELEDGAVLEAEVHWYEGRGIGKKEIKIKKYL